MNVGESGHKKFRVATSAAVISQVKNYLAIAIELGKEDMFFTAVKKIYERLENEPDIFGEPLFNLKSLVLEMRLGIVLPLAVTYGVNYPVKVVFVSQVKILI